MTHNRTAAYRHDTHGKCSKQAQNAGTAKEAETEYLGKAKTQKFEQATNELVIAYPHPSVRLVNGEPDILLIDNLISVRATMDKIGNLNTSTSYIPFRKADETLHDLATKPESKGFIGERYDMDSGLHYRGNARWGGKNSLSQRKR